MKIRKGDIVKIISGKDRGKNGKVLKVFPKMDKILVEGMAIKKHHERPKKAGQKGEIVSLNSPINVSNVTLFCKNCNKGVRTGTNLQGEQKIRICKKCKNTI